MLAKHENEDVFYSGKDRDGVQVVTIVVKRLVRRTRGRQDARKLLVFHLEMIDIEQQGEPITMVIDAGSAGLR